MAALRRSRGLSQAQMAAALGISPSAIGMYEQGRREPSLDTVVALSRFYGVSTDFLLTGNPTPGEEAKLKGLLEERLDAAQRRMARQGRQPFSQQELAVLFTAMLTET